MALALQAQLSSQKLRQVTIFSRTLLVFPLKSPGKRRSDPKSLDGPLLSRSALEQKEQHSPERLGGAPEQLVSDRKGGEVETAFFEGKPAQTSDRHLQRAAHRYRSQLAQACLALVRNNSHPRVRLGEHLLDFVHRQISPEFYGERLAVATHCADAHANAVDWDRVSCAAKNLVAFRLTFPLFAALAVPRSLSIHGSKLPASGNPNCRLGKDPSRSAEVTALSNSRIAEAGSSSSDLAAWCTNPICSTSSRTCSAPAPEAA